MNSKYLWGAVIALLWSACNVYKVPMAYNGLSSSSSAQDSVVVESSSSSTPTPALVYGQMQDRDGSFYKTIRIGDREWTVENLHTHVDGAGMACRDSVGSDCAQAFYQYAAAKTVCPSDSGWALPSDQDYRALVLAAGQKVDPSCADQSVAQELLDFPADAALGMCPAKANEVLKSTSLWSVNGLDLLGFAAQPHGYRDLTLEFIQNGSYAYFWSSDSLSKTEASSWYVTKNQAVVHAPNDLQVWLSVRCVRSAK